MNTKIYRNTLKCSWLDTKLGSMIAISDDNSLYLLEFTDRRGLDCEIERLKMQTTIVRGDSAPIASIDAELNAYFEGGLKEFKTPIHILGTNFQKLVWNELIRIPYGQTRSYGEQSKAIGKPSACRAVANANGANQLAIVIPCHRVINSNGNLGGYAGGMERKKWLIEHERSFMCGFHKCPK